MCTSSKTNRFFEACRQAFCALWSHKLHSSASEMLLLSQSKIILFSTAACAPVPIGCPCEGAHLDALSMMECQAHDRGTPWGPRCRNVHMHHSPCFLLSAVSKTSQLLQACSKASLWAGSQACPNIVQCDIIYIPKATLSRRQSVTPPAH